VSEQRPRVVIVGGDAAGMSAATHLARETDAQVVVVERGPYTSYSMCGIPYLIAGDLEEPTDLVVRTPEEFRAMGMTVHVRTEAVAVDAERRTVRVRDLVTGDERDEHYAALLLAPGAQPSIPPVEGLERYGRIVHTLDEGERVRDLLRPIADERGGACRVVVIGAGYIGMEIAEALVRHGHNATIVDRSRQVMKTLDDDLAAVVEQVLVDFGVEVRLETSVVGARGTGDRLEAVITSDGDLPADVLIVAAGSGPTSSSACPPAAPSGRPAPSSSTSSCAPTSRGSGRRGTASSRTTSSPGCAATSSSGPTPTSRAGSRPSTSPPPSTAAAARRPSPGSSAPP
jgi:NADPH-dependent 2,4-dienoyl-CoA reductase/sulfur reductase-like enzyme